MTKRHKEVIGKIPEILEPLMTPHLEKLNKILSPGLTLVHWTSLSLDHFSDTVASALDKLELLVNRSKDMLDIQIHGVLDKISSTLLCELPENEPWTLEEFVSRIKVIKIIHVRCLCVHVM